MIKQRSCFHDMTFKKNTYPFRSAGSEWYTCLPFSAMVRVPTCVVSLWLTRTGWNWLFDSVEPDGTFIWLMGTLPFCSGVSANGFLRTDSGVDVATTLISGTVGGICFRQVWEWASCSFFIWRIATVALKACWRDESMISESQYSAVRQFQLCFSVKSHFDCILKHEVKFKTITITTIVFHNAVHFHYQCDTNDSKIWTFFTWMKPYYAQYALSSMLIMDPFQI